MGAKMGKLFHEPNLPPVFHKYRVEYKKHQNTSIAIIYEKLLILKNRMHTQIARQTAEKGIQFIEIFLHSFFL